MIEVAIYNILKNDTAVSNIVGAKVYPLQAGETAVEPYIVVEKLLTEYEHTMTGTVDLVLAKFQISCWENSYYDAITLTDAVRGCLDNFVGTDSGSGVTIQCIHVGDEVVLYDFTAGVDKSKHYGKGLPFKVWYDL